MSSYNLDNIFNYINRHQVNRMPRTNVKDVGSLVDIEIADGTKEPAIVLAYLTKQQLRSYLKHNNIDHDIKNPTYSYNYSVLGHFKLSDIKDVVANNTEIHYNLIVLQVTSKTQYIVLTQIDEALSKCISSIIDTSSEVPELLQKLFRLGVMKLATNDMKRAYESGQSIEEFTRQEAGGTNGKSSDISAVDSVSTSTG